MLDIILASMDNVLEKKKDTIGAKGEEGWFVWYFSLL